MPAKGKTLIHGERHNPLNKELYNKFIDRTGINVDFDTFKNIIQHTNGIIRDAISEEEAGMRLPERLGTVIVTKYKSKKTPWNWVETLRLKKMIPHVNLHSMGYICHIKWFKMGVTFSNNFIYKFVPYRSLKRKVAKNFKEGKQYFKWENSDLWSSTKMERRFIKFYKNREKNGNDNPR